MNLLTPLVPRHPDGVLRVYCAMRILRVSRDTAAIDAKRHETAAWLSSVYAGPVIHCHYARRLHRGSDTPISDPVTFLVNGPCDLVLMGEIRELARSPAMLYRFIDHYVDNGVRLIAWRDGIDTASNDWQSNVFQRVIRMSSYLRPRRRMTRTSVTNQ